jgi:hypothetical protein
MRDGRRPPRWLVPALLVTLVFAGSLAYAFSNNGQSSIELRLILVDAEGDTYTDLSGLPVAVEVEAWILEPPPGGWRLALQKVSTGSLTFSLPEGLIVEASKAWLRHEGARASSKPSNLEAALDSVGRPVRVAVHVLAKNGTLLYRGTRYLIYSPAKVLRGEQQILQLVVPLRGVSLGELRSKLGAEEWFPCDMYSWNLTWRVTAEDVLDNDSSIPYITSDDGAVYVALPVLIVENWDWGGDGPPADGVFDGFLYINGNYKASFKAEVGIGFGISNKLGSGDWTGGLSGSIVSAGSTYEDHVRILADLPEVEGGEVAVAYVYARPVVEFWTEYVYDFCGPNPPMPTGWEELDVYAEDFYVYYVDPSRGVKYLLTDVEKTGGYPEWLQPALDLLGISFSPQDLSIPGTPLSDGDLDPGEFVSLSTIVSWLDSQEGCETYDATLPVGLVAGLALQVAMPEAAPLAASIATTVTLGGDAEGSSEIEGQLANTGDISEWVSGSVSSIEYRKDPPWWCLWCDPCYYKVPLIYVKGS